ncbi:hypothetical protein [Marilutibacter spongiae]|uniref:Uncharacterized protein n=1 Tax=Marilutibacter spongiae TaxID=2025720 RepID=A0A7W3TJN7_9GAMM|nr:hypothetical protein [Lysobacter spongiae]MBB1059546.1 hypothetical protein [Lysobacter spongiae]
MNTHRPDPDPNASDVAQDARRQAEAERPATAGGAPDPRTDRYRAVYHAIRSAPMPEPPASFALQMERLALAADASSDTRARGGNDTWLLGLLPGVAVLALVGWGGAEVIEGLRTSAAHWRGLPWPMLLATGAGLAGAWALDRWLAKQRPSPR